MKLTLASQEKVWIVFPGDLDSSTSLLRHLRRNAHEALIDGIPHRQFWGDTLFPEKATAESPVPMPRLLRSEDEAEVERLYQLLKTVGHLDTRQQDEN